MSDLVKREEVLPEAPASILQLISRAATDPTFDADKMERMLAMYERVSEQQRKASFAAALSRLQAKLPQIEKTGQIIVKGQLRSRYAPIEDIDEAIRPLTSEEGFALSFDSASADGKLFTLSCTLSHKDGHSETKSLMLPIDASDYRSNVQSIGSTVSYGKRQLIKMHLNIIERGEDTDGMDPKTISEDQAQTINTLLTDTKADKGKFLRLIAGVERIEDIPARDYRRVIAALEEKRRVMHK